MELGGEGVDDRRRLFDRPLVGARDDCGGDVRRSGIARRDRPREVDDGDRWLLAVEKRDQEPTGRVVLDRDAVSGTDDYDTTEPLCTRGTAIRP
nr:hypothetical protein [Salinigranum marinum]